MSFLPNFTDLLSPLSPPLFLLSPFFSFSSSSFHSLLLLSCPPSSLSFLVSLFPSLLFLVFPSSLSFLLFFPPITPSLSTADAVNILGDVSNMTFIQLEELGIGLNVGISWEEALHSALMPVTPQASMGSLADSKLTTVNS